MFLKMLIIINLFFLGITCSVLAGGLEEGKEAERQGDLVGAIAIYRNLLETAPEDPRARTALQKAQKALDAREKEAESARRRDQEADARRADRETRLQKDLLMKRYDEAMGFLSKGDQLKASHDLNSLLEESPEFLLPQKGLKKVQFSLGKRLQRLDFPTPQHYSAAQGIYLYNQGRWAEALPLLEKALAKGDLPEDLAEAKISVYAEKSIRNMQRDEQKKVLTLPPLPRDFSPSPAETEAERLYREGLRLYGQEQRARAETLLLEALRLDPAHEDARSALENLRGEDRHAEH